jgi:hypothetical protein
LLVIALAHEISYHVARCTKEAKGNRQYFEFSDFVRAKAFKISLLEKAVKKA